MLYLYYEISRHAFFLSNALKLLMPKSPSRKCLRSKYFRDLKKIRATDKGCPHKVPLSVAKRQIKDYTYAN